MRVRPEVYARGPVWCQARFTLSDKLAHGAPALPKRYTLALPGQKYSPRCLWGAAYCLQKTPLKTAGTLGVFV
jgi:hypothetical protein